LPNTQFSFCGFSRSFFFFFLNSRCVWSDRQKYPSASYTHNHSNILKENSLRSYFFCYFDRSSLNIYTVDMERILTILLDSTWHGELSRITVIVLNETSYIQQLGSWIPRERRIVLNTNKFYYISTIY
jgi:hypothetical protein